MRFGTIGAGTIGQALARHVVEAGYPITLSNRRGPQSLTEVIAELGPLASAGTVAEAAEADIVFLATHWKVVGDVLDPLPNWNGRILVDATNTLDFVDGGVVPVDVGDKTGSEIVAAHAPGARVVKAFNTLYASYIGPDPRHEAGRQVVFYAGDDADAKATIGSILDEFGFAAVDVGPLDEGGLLMEVNGGPLSGLHVLKQD
ncbi:putative dinucleotide-binding enzyme [Rhodococcus sp. LBL1]|uniref:Dinucleotide-binding enzyme n=1 Tax=Prescottella agglutinans TaxID=1644129 RepID=A0ABT6M6G0_9NOCA|nr:NAD(P)-binding domain-containing protein [Prescottella agglutinans]MDH6279904.1 putative dinucleotide-binding enzyme [Prescottella agglutinans]MDH6679430.1 putative dinucleotide-binding enzyme [Rhodococcus sp. LBL1]MDH6685431.1 putative dinucleotide-binding enzyme [Rhodococcus sp. LBL2]